MKESKLQQLLADWEVQLALLKKVTHTTRFKLCRDQLIRAMNLHVGKVAVLCVAKNSFYKDMPDVECFDIKRDVRTFDGSMPVVAHPPCRAWSAFCSHQALPESGEKDLGPLCVDWVKKCGGVLEHPAYSTLWDYCNLPKPGQPITNGLWTAHVHQSWWGDIRTKQTWLLFSGIEQVNIPMRPHGIVGDRERWNKMSKTQRSASVPEFAAWLVTVARMTNEHFRP